MEGGVGGDSGDHCAEHVGEVRAKSVDQQRGLVITKVTVVAVVLLVAMVVPMDDGGDLK